VTDSVTNASTGGNLRRSILDLSLPVDAASLAAFRILFGCVMGVAMIRFLAKGWVKTLYLDPVFHFPWCSWITPWPGNGMYFHIAALIVLVFGIAVGFCYRFCAILFCAGFTYLEFIDRTTYLNHYYLVSLLSGLLIFLPAHCKWSVDARLNSQVASETIARWQIGLLRFQIGVVFVFAGLAKLNPDWLFSAQPMRMWLMARSDLPVIGSWLAEPSVAYAASWFGALYDLSVPFLLLWPRTRVVALGALIFFHGMTALLFPIGMFPWIMITASLLFLPPDWPRRLLLRKQNVEGVVASQSLKPGAPRLSAAGAVFLVIYCGAQILVPLRSWFHPQQGAWEMRGFNFAWRVMLVEKTGYVEFYEFDPATGSRERIPVAGYITRRQQTMMAQDPFLIRQFSQFLGRERNVKEMGHEIRADAFATLNGHPSQRLIVAEANLAGELPEEWIAPFAGTDGGAAMAE
jgi:vitamin K-dependent gamma-carboxylase